MKNWKIGAGLVAICVLFGAASGEAITGLGFGVHGGLGNYRGDVFRYEFGGQEFVSGDVGSAVQYGGHVKVGTLPIIDFYLNVDYFSKKEFYVYSLKFNNIDYTRTIDFQDLYISVDGKFNIYSPPLSPAAIYLGGGIGSHLLNTEIAEELPTAVPDDYQETIDFFKDNGRFDIHGLLGAKFNPPVIPLEFYLEGRFAYIKTKDEDKGRKDDLQAMSIIAGATFNLP
jgi:hypothetical protein